MYVYKHRQEWSLQFCNSALPSPTGNWHLRRYDRVVGLFAKVRHACSECNIHNMSNLDSQTLIVVGIFKSLVILTCICNGTVSASLRFRRFYVPPFEEHFVSTYITPLYIGLKFLILKWYFFLHGAEKSSHEPCIACLCLELWEKKKCCIVIGRKRLRRGNSAATCLSKVISGANIQFDVSKFKFLTSNIRASTFDFDDFRVGKKDV